jgi:hypothetical protein
VCSKPGIGSP